LWFPNWIPTTAPATFGACVGLFFLAGASRFVEALRVACSPPLTSTRRFLLGPECVCATLFMLLSGVNYFLMLAVMQFDVWFFIAILLGLWAGELGFGRYCRTYGSVLGPGMARFASPGSEPKAGLRYRDVPEDGSSS
jgi:copper transporter 1